MVREIKMLLHFVVSLLIVASLQTSHGNEHVYGTPNSGNILIDIFSFPQKSESMQIEMKRRKKIHSKN